MQKSDKNTDNFYYRNPAYKNVHYIIATSVNNPLHLWQLHRHLVPEIPVSLEFSQSLVLSSITAKQKRTSMIDLLRNVQVRYFRPIVVLKILHWQQYLLNILLWRNK